MSDAKDLVETFLDYELKRARGRLREILESMKQEIESALRDLDGDGSCGRPSGLANNLTDAFHRIGELYQLQQFAKLREGEKRQAARAAEPAVRPDLYRIRLSPSAADGCVQALREWADDQRPALPPEVRVEADILLVPRTEVLAVCRVLRAYAGSPRGSAARRRGTKAAAQRLISLQLEAQGPATPEML